VLGAATGKGGGAALRPGMRDLKSYKATSVRSLKLALG
jgi:hypothetical protein